LLEIPNFITCAQMGIPTLLVIIQHGVQFARMFSLIDKSFYFCADRFRFASDDLNLLARPRVIVDRYYQADQLTKMDLICVRQILEVVCSLYYM
jgi:hypothetical protein